MTEQSPKESDQMPEEGPQEQVPDDTGAGEDSPSASREAGDQQAKEAGADEANEAGGQATGNPQSGG
jgi:hypothetical protein